MKDWSDGKNFLFDHIFDCAVFGSMLLVGAFLDPVITLLYSCGFHLVPHEITVHDYSFGKFQITLLVLGAFKIIRLFQKLIQWTYWK